MSLVDELVLHLGMSAGDIQRIIATAPLRYKVYNIAKRNGGTRTIAQPSRELKAIQRYVAATNLTSLRVHNSAMGYVKNRNIKKNAEAHRHNSVILKLDFERFFPSLTVRDWKKYIKEKCLNTPLYLELETYSKILFWGGITKQPVCLSIGAPTSPMLSNILMYDLDVKFSEIALATNSIYTRYADDITVSGSREEDVRKFERQARKIIRTTRSPRLVFNEEKRGIYMRGQRRMVTGLIITPGGSISIGRERKRLISSMLNHVVRNTATPEEKAQLKGLLGFCISTEPNFVNRMRLKYGSDVVDGALSYWIPRSQ